MIDAVQAGYMAVESLIADGTDPSELDRSDADEALVSAMGPTWVIRAAGGHPDAHDAWDAIALPWCARYAAAFRERAQELCHQGTPEK